MSCASGCSQRPEWLQEANVPHASGKLLKNFLEKAGGEMKEQGREKESGGEAAGSDKDIILYECVCVEVGGGCHLFWGLFH